MSTRTPTQPPPAQRLRFNMAAMRLSFTWLGVRKSLSLSQRAEAAESFGAEGEFLTAGKKLIDTRDSDFRAVTAVRSQARSYFKSVSLPFPEPGLRLVPQDCLEDINAQMLQFKAALDAAVEQLDAHFDELKSDARIRLGRLYNPSDYPVQLTGLFDLSWDWPSVEPPEYLRQLSPDLYRAECERVQARFNEAVQLAEQAFLDELSKLITHLTDKLSGDEDGRPKRFNDSAIENLTGFFERFQRLNVGSNGQLDELVEQAQNLITGVNPQQLRDNAALRQQVVSQLAGTQSVLDGMLVDRPRRAIQRRPAQHG